MPVLDYKDGQFIFECSYEERSLPKDARFWFNRITRQWVTQSARCAVRLREFATQSARARIVDTLVPGFQSRDDNSQINYRKPGRINKRRRA